MSGILVRNALLFGGMIVAGLVCVRAAPAVISQRGSASPLIAMASSPGSALLALMLCTALATALACVVGRVVNASIGMFVLGAGLFALAGRMAGARELAFASPKPSILLLLALETLIWSLVALGLTLLVFRVAGGFADIEPDDRGERPHWLTSSAAMKMAAAGLLMLPAVWLVAQSPMRGQAIAAAIIGAIAAGLVGRLVSPHVQPVLAYVAPIVCGSLAYLIAWALTRQPLDDALIAGASHPFGRPMPLDYVAGSFLGGSFGLGWAKSFLHHEPVAAPAA